MTIDELRAWHDASPAHVLVDLRVRQEYTAGHVPGALAAPYRQHGWADMISQWARQQSPSGEIGLFGDNPVVVGAAADAFRKAGITTTMLFDQGLGPWREAGLPVVAVKPLTVDELAASLSKWTVIDVREPYELRSGRIPRARSIPLGALEQEAAALPKDSAYAIVCASGNRSQSAAAFLAEQGFQVANVVGGMSLWLGARHPIE